MLVTLYTCVPEILFSNLGRVTAYPGYLCRHHSADIDDTSDHTNGQDDTINIFCWVNYGK